MDNKHKNTYSTFNTVPSKLVTCKGLKEFFSVLVLSLLCDILDTPMKIPMVIFDDADINSAADAVVKGVWEYNGDVSIHI